MFALDTGAAGGYGFGRRRPMLAGGIAGALSGARQANASIADHAMLGAPIAANPASLVQRQGAADLAARSTLGGAPAAGLARPTLGPPQARTANPVAMMGGLRRRRQSGIAGALGMKPRPQIRMGGPAY